MEIAALFDVDVDADALFVVLDDERKTVSERASALRLLTHLQDPRADPAIDAFLDSDDPEMRVAARSCLLLRRPDDALEQSDGFLFVEGEHSPRAVGGAGAGHVAARFASQGASKGRYVPPHRST